MKKILQVLLFSFVFSSLLNAQNSPQFKFDEANEILEKGEYNNALSVYREIEETDFVSGALYLNMAIAAVQVDSLGLAKYYFKKASIFDDVEPKATKAWLLQELFHC